MSRNEKHALAPEPAATQHIASLQPVVFQWKRILFHTFCIVLAIVPAGGGRNSVSKRILRHVNQIAHTELEFGSLFGIFSTIIVSHAEERRLVFCDFIGGAAEERSYREVLDSRK